MYKVLHQWLARQITDPGVASLILADTSTFVGIDHAIFSKVILLHQLIQEGFVTITNEIWAQSTG